jgi:hypothetical protein
MPRVGFEQTIPLPERAKTLHISDPAAAVVGARAMALLQTLLNQGMSMPTEHRSSSDNFRKFGRCRLDGVGV